MPTLALTACGVAVDVHLSGSQAAQAHAALIGPWSRCVRASGPAVADVEAHVDHYEALPATIAAIASRATIAAIDHLAGTRLMLHAAGLEAAPGRVVALVAASGTGKTTAAMTLGRTFGYVSDETVTCTFDGTVTPYPKPLSIGDPLTVKHQVSPDDAGLAELSGHPLRLAGIALLERDPEGPAEPHIEELDVALACALLAPQVSYLSSMPTPLETLAGAIADVGGAVRIVYREAATLNEAVAALATRPRAALGAYEGAAALAEARLAVAGARPAAADARPAAADARARNAALEETPLPPVAPSVDAYFGRQGVTVMAGGIVSHLSALATLVFRAAQEGATAAEVAHAATLLFGAAPGGAPERLIAASVAQLRELNILA